MLRTVICVLSSFGNRARAIATALVVAGAAHLSVPLYGQSAWGANPTWVSPGTQVGIGQQNPVSWSALDVNGNIYSRAAIVAEGVFKSNTTSGSNYFLSNVGIGTTGPPYLLSVKGTIGAQEVVVTNTSGWPDYVFNPTYRLRPLTEVAFFIKDHHHLPDIPSEAEVKEKGVGIGEMQTKLLAKIEELTLHMIQAEEKNRELQTRIAQLEARGAPSGH